MNLSQKLYNSHIKPYSNKHQITVTFPNLFANIPGKQNCLAVPMRISLLKIIENNPTLQILTPKETRIDVPAEFLKKLDVQFKDYDMNRICFIFVEDMPVLIDYSENSNWKHSPIYTIAKKYKDDTKNIIKTVIKYHYDKSSSDQSPVKIFPFLYPGSNDYRDFPEFRQEKTYKEKHDVYSRVTYNPKYADKFIKCYHQNTFKHSISTYWGCPLVKSYDPRRRYTELAKQIENSNFVTHTLFKSVSMNEYYENLSQSKFGISIRGSAKFSHREMELSSIGLPWFGEDRTQNFYKPFLPGEHYIPISITTKDFLDIFKYYNEHYDEALKIGLNAREYFNKWHRQTGLQLLFKEICQEILSLN